MYVAGIDFDTHGIDLVLLNEEDDRAIHGRWQLLGHDAFERARYVQTLDYHLWNSTAWRNVIALGIEDPRGPSRNVDAPIYRVQGAILACLSSELLVERWMPQAWRKRLQIAHIGKEPIREYALAHWLDAPQAVTQDALDAFCVAAATRAVLKRETVSA